MSIASPRIFVSHSHKDDEFGVRLIRDLMRVLPERDAVWYDSHGGLQGGVTWWRTIVHEITTRNIFIVILSPDAIESQWVNDEIDLAWQEKNARGMRLLPLLRHPCTIRPDVRTLQVIDFQSSREYDLAFNDLLTTLGIAEPQPVHQPASPPPQHLLARLLPQIEASYNAHDWPDVIRKTDHLLKQSSDDLPPTLYLWYGDSLQHRNQPDKAQGAYEMALVIVSDKQQRLAILRSYAALLLSRQRWDEALALATEALELVPNDLDWSVIKEKAQGQGKNKVEWIKEGNNLQDLKRFDEALVAYDQAIRLDPNYAEAYLGRGNVLFDLKRYDEALTAYNQAIQLNSTYAFGYHGRGNVLFDLKRYDEALAAYNQAIQLNSTYAFGYLSKGNALIELKRYDEALASYDRAIQLNSTYAIAYYNKGVALQIMKRSKESQACFDKAKELGFPS